MYSGGGAGADGVGAGGALACGDGEASPLGPEAPPVLGELMLDEFESVETFAFFASALEAGIPSPKYRAQPTRATTHDGTSHVVRCKSTPHKALECCYRVSSASRVPFIKENEKGF